MSSHVPSRSSNSHCLTRGRAIAFGSPYTASSAGDLFDGADDLDNFSDGQVWTAYRVIQNQAPINKSGLTLLALKIRASTVNNGQLDQINGEKGC